MEFGSYGQIGHLGYFLNIISNETGTKIAGQMSYKFTLSSALEYIDADLIPIVGMYKTQYGHEKV